MAGLGKPITKKAITAAFSKGERKIPTSRITKNVLRKVEDFGTVKMYEKRKGKTGGWLYADYKDPSTGKWVRNVPVRKSDYKAFVEYHQNAKKLQTHEIWTQSASSHFRTVMNASGHKRVMARTALNKARGLLKAMRHHMADPDFDADFAGELMDALQRGDYVKCQNLVSEWESKKTRQEINDYYEYEEEFFVQ